MLDNPLIRGRDLDFLLFDVHRVQRLWRWPGLAHVDRETVDLFMATVRRFARSRALPELRALDECEAKLVDGRIQLDPRVGQLFHEMVDLGLLTAERSHGVGGAALPQSIVGSARMWVMAANANAISYVALTSAAAHLIEAFGGPELQAQFMAPMYAGRWTGTMALTEADAGSSLAEVATRARACASDSGDMLVEGCYKLQGSKIFITGGDQDFAENTVHLTLARIEGAPAGTGGISLFAVPRLRPSPAGLVDNDVAVTQNLHKLGVRAIPSVALALGERDDCRGWLVGEAGRGLAYMFQMMNEARLCVGANAVALASAGFHAALAYARERVQGRPVGQRGGPPVAIIEHADVRRMLLAQKAIVEGCMSLYVATADLHDVARHHPQADDRQKAGELEGFLTPLVKTLPAEWGFRANSLAVQVHGGYGYCRDFLPELWLRDQRLNAIHEGTTGIQALDLLGRKVLDPRARGPSVWLEQVDRALHQARDQATPVDGWRALEQRRQRWQALVESLRHRAAEGPQALAEVMAMADDFMTATGVLVVAWQWLVMATASLSLDPDTDAEFRAGKSAGWQYWLAHELPRADAAFDRMHAGIRGDVGVAPASL